MNADGSNTIQLTHNEHSDGEPVWSPDGQHIAFSSDRDGDDEIYVMNIDGSNTIQLTHNASRDGEPVWSPDGQHIAFSSDRDGDDEIYVMNADGSNIVQLTQEHSDDSSPEWSPDSQRIAFESGRDGDWEIYVMNADGSNVAQLTHNLSADRVPAWSPDGQRIAFSSDRDGDFEIYVMLPDGSNTIQLTHNQTLALSPAWSPDGLLIAFDSFGDGGFGIYTILASGTGLVQVTSNDDAAPRWSPNVGATQDPVSSAPSLATATEETTPSGSGHASASPAVRRNNIVVWQDKYVYTDGKSGLVHDQIIYIDRQGDVTSVPEGTRWYVRNRPISLGVHWGGELTQVSINGVPFLDVDPFYGQDLGWVEFTHLVTPGEETVLRFLSQSARSGISWDFALMRNNAILWEERDHSDTPYVTAYDYSLYITADGELTSGLHRTPSSLSAPMRAANLRANQMQFSIRIGNLLSARTWLRAHPSAPMKIVSANNVRRRAKQRLDLRHHNRMG